MATTTWLRAHCAKSLVLWPSTSKFTEPKKKKTKKIEKQAFVTFGCQRYPLCLALSIP